MPNSDDKIKTIDVKKVLESKLGSKVRFVPKCVLNWLRKILHEDEINEYLDEVKDIKGVKWLDATRKYLDMRIKIEGEENFPSPRKRSLYLCMQSSVGRSRRNRHWRGACRPLRRKTEVSCELLSHVSAGAEASLHSCNGFRSAEPQSSAAHKGRF